MPVKRWGQKKWCNIGRQPYWEFSLTSNECRISNQRLIHAAVSWIVSWEQFVGRKYLVYTIYGTIHEDDNKPRLRQLNVKETWKISVLTVVLNKKNRLIYNFIIVTCYIRVSKTIRRYDHVIPELHMSMSQQSERCEVDIQLQALNATFAFMNT
jgi:hypothetical protein